VKGDFNLAVAFRVFDKNSKGWIHHYDLKEGLHDLGINATLENCKLFIIRYDTDLDGKLTFQEFNAAFKPLKG
jgi:Ca2+-binding EF-hand superfamily protein